MCVGVYVYVCVGKNDRCAVIIILSSNFFYKFDKLIAGFNTWSKLKIFGYGPMRYWHDQTRI